MQKALEGTTQPPPRWSNSLAHPMETQLGKQQATALHRPPPCLRERAGSGAGSFRLMAAVVTAESRELLITALCNLPAATDQE